MQLVLQNGKEMPPFEIHYDVTFGDCDPAGIVFYPNIYKWLDRCCHDWLRLFGGHTQICQNHGSKGLGLMEAQTKFLSPMTDGDSVRVQMQVADWAAKSVVLSYAGFVGTRPTFTATERRALLIETDKGMKAGNMDGLKRLVSA